MWCNILTIYYCILMLRQFYLDTEDDNAEVSAVLGIWACLFFIVLANIINMVI